MSYSLSLRETPARRWGAGELGRWGGESDFREIVQREETCNVGEGAAGETDFTDSENKGGASIRDTFKTDQESLEDQLTQEELPPKEDSSPKNEAGKEENEAPQKSSTSFETTAHHPTRYRGDG